MAGSHRKARVGRDLPDRSGTPRHFEAARHARWGDKAAVPRAVQMAEPRSSIEYDNVFLGYWGRRSAC